MEKVRCGVMGFGFMGKTHALNLVKHPNASLDAVFSLGDDRAAIEKMGASFHEDWHEMIERDDLDAIVIATPTYTHGDITLGALEQGKHVFLEKPMERTVEKSRKIMDASEKAGVQLAMGHVLRFDPRYIGLRQEAFAGSIGTVKMIRCTRRGAPPSWGIWFFDEVKSGTVILDLSIHDIDYIMWMAGSMPRKVTAMASMLDFGERRIQGISHVIMEFEPRDQIDANIKIELGFAEASWGASSTFPFSTLVEISGNRGLIESRVPGNHSLDIFSETGHQVESNYRDDAYSLEMDDFIRAVIGERPPKVTAREGFEAVQVCLAALESARTGSSITLEEIS